MKIQFKEKQNGITLIALVITIIVLLILGGVSIATLVGENGIITKAQEVKETSKIAEEIEEIKLAIIAAKIGNNGNREFDQNNLHTAINSQLSNDKAIITDNGDGTFNVCLEQSKREYKITKKGVEEGIDWNKAMGLAKAPASQDEQRNDRVIGIGTDGNPVDMDLWKYTLLEDDTFLLNDNNELSKAGYLGTFTSDGEIIGKIPQYISLDNGKNFKKVTDLRCLFIGCIDLKVAPVIPNTVTSVRDIFNGCENLLTIPTIPSSVTNMQGTFNRCSKIEEAPIIPNSVTNMMATFQNCTNLVKIYNLSSAATDMRATFYNCESLTEIPEIPTNVQSMYMAFYHCVKLQTVSAIPNSVTDMRNTFHDCISLKGKIIINANLTGAMLTETEKDYEDIFKNIASNEKYKIQLSGTCPVLKEIVQYTNNPNITLEV